MKIIEYNHIQYIEDLGIEFIVLISILNDNDILFGNERLKIVVGFD
jgi:hypothetical protein